MVTTISKKGFGLAASARGAGGGVSGVITVSRPGAREASARIVAEPDVTEGAVRQGVRVQQVAFELANVLASKWREDRSDAIPAHRLSPQILDAASHFIEEHDIPVKTRNRQDLAINQHFGKAVAKLVSLTRFQPWTGKVFSGMRK